MPDLVLGRPMTSGARDSKDSRDMLGQALWKSISTQSILYCRKGTAMPIWVGSYGDELCQLLEVAWNYHAILVGLIHV